MRHVLFRLILVAVAIGASAASVTAATVELLNGTTIQCTVLSKDETSVTVEVMKGGMKVKQTIPLTNVHKVTINAKEYLINERPAGGSKTKGSKTTKAKSSTKSSAGVLEEDADEPAGGGKTLRTKAEVDKLIDEMGRSPPEWFEATPLDYPQSLDLDWPEKPGEGWNNQKNVGQYIWDIVNPNQNKWREGVRLLHHLLTLHKDDAEKRVRIMNSLAIMYHNLHEDHARAAFWWRQAGIDKGGRFTNQVPHLAECYWRLGNKQMALDLLKKQSVSYYGSIKLLADMGNTQEAQQLADRISKLPNAQPDIAFLYAADGFRVAGKFPQALQYYQKVLDVPAKDPGKGRVERNHKRAQASLEAIKLFELSDVSKVADGTYQDESLGYEGPVRVEVVVAGGKIESVRVVQHREKQYYSSINDTPPKIIAKQGVKGVDSTSSATITSEAIINATAKALASGAK
jgi:uncharacterized protein with FMN-binding domain